MLWTLFAVSFSEFSDVGLKIGFCFESEKHPKACTKAFYSLQRLYVSRNEMIEPTATERHKWANVDIAYKILLHWHQRARFIDALSNHRHATSCSRSSNFYQAEAIVLGLLYCLRKLMLNLKSTGEQNYQITACF